MLKFFISVIAVPFDRHATCEQKRKWITVRLCKNEEIKRNWLN